MLNMSLYHYATEANFTTGGFSVKALQQLKLLSGARIHCDWLVCRSILIGWLVFMGHSRITLLFTKQNGLVHVGAGRTVTFHS